MKQTLQSLIRAAMSSPRLRVLCGPV